MSSAPASDPSPRASAPRRAWPHLRASFVAAHIGAVLVLAIPDSRGVSQSRAAWKSATVQAELEAWSERLTALGLPIDPPTLEAEVFDAARSWTDVVARVRAPVEFYADYFGVYQTWRMFVAPHRYPAKLHVELEQDGRWRPIHIARSTEHDWRASQLDHVRVRAVLFRYGWPSYARDYRAFARWLAIRAAEDFPTARRARIGMLGYRTPTPQEVRRGDIPVGELRQTIVIELEDLR